MKCPQCGMVMERKQGEYVCPNDGTKVNPKTTLKNRLYGVGVLFGGLVVTAFMIVLEASGGKLIFLNIITIPFGYYILAALSGLAALAGLGGMLGMVDVVDMFSNDQ